MDKSELARHLTKLAKELLNDTPASREAALKGMGKYQADSGGVHKAIRDVAAGKGGMNIYAIVKVTFGSSLMEGGSMGDAVVSGTLGAIGDYIEDIAERGELVNWYVLGITTDRNEARKKGTEV